MQHIYDVMEKTLKENRTIEFLDGIYDRSLKLRGLLREEVADAEIKAELSKSTANKILLVTHSGIM